MNNKKSEYNKEYWLKNKDKIKKRHEEYLLKNADKIRESRKKYNINNKEKIKTYLLNNKDRIREHSKKYRLNFKKQVIDKYSNGENKCANCGLTDFKNLTIDHIDGNGEEHRKKIGMGAAFYKWLIDSNFPQGFQVLCFGCNLEKGARK